MMLSAICAETVSFPSCGSSEGGSDPSATLIVLASSADLSEPADADRSGARSTAPRTRVASRTIPLIGWNPPFGKEIDF
jgi:hypothetical protein